MLSIGIPVALTPLSGPAPGTSPTGSHVPFSDVWFRRGLLRYVPQLSGQDDGALPLAPSSPVSAFYLTLRLHRRFSSSAHAAVSDHAEDQCESLGIAFRLIRAS
jgi:hypothetical protein